MQTFNHNNNLNNPDYLKPFFIGLLEAKGGIYFRKVGVNSSRFFLIQLELQPENKIMLECINKYLELKASIYERQPTNKKNLPKIVMYGSSKHTMGKLLSILQECPLLDTTTTVFKRLFILPLQELHSRDKSKNQSLCNQHRPFDYQLLPQKSMLQKQESCYFKFWLSGFLEGGASFTIYTKNDCRISLSTRDYKLINHIKQFFQSNNKIVTKNNTDQTVRYQLILTNASINNVHMHLKEHPLLGHKQATYNKFYSHFNQIPKRETVLLPLLEPKRDVASLTLWPKLYLYIEPFFVGLLEGDGCIYLGRTKGGNLSYGRFQIKLKYTPENLRMLQLVSSHIGGTIRYEKKKGNDQIAWNAVSQKDVKNILNILERYPLLTSRKICQLEHLKQCMVDRSWNLHLQTRDSKYLNQQNLIDHYKYNFKIPSYFGPWLSGFSEAEGHFGSTKHLRYYIGQNDDWYILNAIKQYFDSHHKLGIHKDLRPNHSQYQYRVSITGKPTIERIIAHFEKNPLLGYKKVSYDLFYNTFYKNK